MIYPEAVVFDLDYTIWPCWCDTHISTPLKAKKSPNERPMVVDSMGFELQVYPDVVRVLEELQANGVKIFSASRTCAPKTAKTLMRLLQIDSFFDDSEWGYGSKVAHLSALSKHHGIPYSEMCLFDDELRNTDVEKKLGVKFLHIPSERIGLTYEIFQRGIQDWARYNNRHA